MTGVSRSGRARAWLCCAEKTCCTRGGPALTGADLVRIATDLAVEPWRFLVARPAAPDDPAGIALDDSGRRHRLELAATPGGCVFLIRTNGGAGRCGLGASAPAACRSFPADLEADRPAVVADLACTCRTWTAADLDEEEIGPALRAALADRAAWRRTVARWNGYAVRRPAEAGLAIEDFLRYVLDVQSALNRGAAWADEPR